MINPIILYLAVIFDIVIGELPEKIHPTVLIGKLIYFLEELFPSTNSKNKFRDFIFGCFITLITVLSVFIVSYYIEKVIISLTFPINILLYSFLLSTTIGYKSLKEFCIKPIENIEDLEKARELVSCVVSRNTKNLDREHILSAAVESLSENIPDSIIAPLFYAIFFGLPGAFVYRAVNTLDAMIGYKNDKYLYYGKLAARLDDILTFIPARISAFLLILFAPLYSGDIKKAIKGLKEAKNVDSINSGYTMAVVANALNITLEKIGYYKLGNGKITKDKALKAFKAVDFTVFGFLLLYTLIYILSHGYLFQ
ncbi:adenosylcobinamide-phosphate synthase CbiB [Methanocaldococcus indicus]|uniref:adenosylcobinamide-phosphate synthase CbiB n=1 Tax=Methanocaldococcus indicus TaxID=213231 RepID=UPI003C6D6DF4